MKGCLKEASHHLMPWVLSFLVRIPGVAAMLAQPFSQASGRVLGFGISGLVTKEGHISGLRLRAASSKLAAVVVALLVV